MAVERTEARLQHGRHISDICKARELQWLRCPTTHDAPVNQLAASQAGGGRDQTSCSGHGPPDDVNQQ